MGRSLEQWPEFLTSLSGTALQPRIIALLRASQKLNSTRVAHHTLVKSGKITPHQNTARFFTMQFASILVK
jgi:hypothetical protein